MYGFFLVFAPPWVLFLPAIASPGRGFLFCRNVLVASASFFCYNGNVTPRSRKYKRKEPKIMTAKKHSVRPFTRSSGRRLLAGLLSGLIYRFVKKVGNATIACFATGFSAALLNTALFMSALVLLFGNTDYVQSLIAGRNVIVFICTFVGINAVVEVIAASIIVGAVGRVLSKFNFRR